MLQSSQVVALPAAIRRGNVALQELSEGVEVETAGSGTSINSLHKPGMGLLTGVMEYRWLRASPEHLVEGVPAHGGGRNKMALMVFSYTNHSVISGKQNPSSAEHLSTNSPLSEMVCIHQEGHFPWGWIQEREKSFQHPGASNREVGEVTASLSTIRAGVSRALTFQGSFGVGSLGSLSSRSPATGSRVEPCCRAATCTGTGTQQWETAGAEASPAAARAAPASCQSPACGWGGLEGAGEEQP